MFGSAARSKEDSMSDPPIKVEVEPLSPKQQEIEEEWAKHWRKVSQELPLQSMGRIEDAARQIIGLTGTLQGLFLAVFAFSDLRTRVERPWNLLFLIPVGLWIASLICATRVFVPREWSGANRNDLDEQAWEDLRTAVEHAVAWKQTRLKMAHYLLIASYIAVLLLIGVWLVALPKQPPLSPTQFVLLTPTPAQSGLATPIP
jgi:hypothetical protein